LLARKKLLFPSLLHQRGATGEKNQTERQSKKPNSICRVTKRTEKKDSKFESVRESVKIGAVAIEPKKNSMIGKKKRPEEQIPRPGESGITPCYRKGASETPSLR